MTIRMQGKTGPLTQGIGLDVPPPARPPKILDAMTSDRPYRAALPFSAAIAELRNKAGSMFDPEIVDAFMTVPEPTWLVQGGIAVQI